MIFGILIDIVVGIVLVVLGWLLWMKQKVSILHDYHYKNVKKEELCS